MGELSQQRRRLFGAGTVRCSRHCNHMHAHTVNGLGNGHLQRSPQNVACIHHVCTGTVPLHSGTVPLSTNGQHAGLANSLGNLPGCL